MQDQIEPLGPHLECCTGMHFWTIFGVPASRVRCPRQCSRYIKSPVLFHVFTWDVQLSLLAFILTFPSLTFFVYSHHPFPTFKTNPILMNNNPHMPRSLHSVYPSVRGHRQVSQDNRGPLAASTQIYRHTDNVFSTTKLAAQIHPSCLPLRI